MNYPPCYCCKEPIRALAVGPTRGNRMRWVPMRKLRNMALAHAQWPIVYHRSCALTHSTAEGRWVP